MIQSTLTVILEFLGPLLLFVLGFGFNSIMDVLHFRHGQSVFSKLPLDHFFGAKNWKRKWRKLDKGHMLELRPEKGLYGWYHRVFNLKYHEKHLFSATALSFLNEGWHLSQFMMYSCFAGSLTWAMKGGFWELLIIWVIIRALGGLYFELMYSNILIKKK